MLVNAIRVTLPPTGAQNWLLTPGPVVALTASEITTLILYHDTTTHYDTHSVHLI